MKNPNLFPIGNAFGFFVFIKDIIYWWSRPEDLTCPPGFFCCAPGGCILFCCWAAFPYGTLFQGYKIEEAEMGNTASADVHVDDIRLLQVHRKQSRPIRCFQYCAKRIIKKLLLTKNFMLQYDFLDTTYDILESTDGWWQRRVSFLSNKGRFDTFLHL